MKHLWILPALLAVILSVARAEENHRADPHRDISITISKSRHELQLHHGEKTIRVYRVFLGSSPKGDKRERGDNRTPEGDYRVVEKKSDSKFHRFIIINYPNLKDADRAYNEGRITADQWVDILDATETRSNPPWDTPLGGFLGIHGIGEDEDFKLRLIGDMDWTNGCVAVTNREVDDLFRLVPIGAAVHIRE